MTEREIVSAYLVGLLDGTLSALLERPSSLVLQDRAREVLNESHRLINKYYYGAEDKHEKG